MKYYLYVTPFFPTLTSWRGPFCYDFVRALGRMGKFRIVVFREGDGTDYEIGGVKVHTFRERRLPSNVFPLLFKRLNQRHFLKRVKEVAHEEGWSIDDVVVCHGHTSRYVIYPLALKQINHRITTLQHHHDPQSFGLNAGILEHCWLYNLIQFPILRRQYEKIDCHVFISEMVKRSFLSAPDTTWTSYEGYKKQMRGLPFRAVRIKSSIILHNGVDKSIFHSETSRAPQTAQLFTIGCVGNFADWKDQMTLLCAMSKLKEKGRGLKAKIVGTGPMLKQCKKYAAANGIDVEFLTEMRHEKLPDFYRSLDLFVLPSYIEGFGCVFTEAHSCGVPFITCEGQGMDDLIPTEDRDKWLCKQRDSEDLARKIEDCIGRIERGERVEQRLNEDQDIDSLVEKFVKEIGL